MEKYDYIIIGAGSAGCVMANRLTEDPSNSVLLLEAGGPDSDFLIHMPGAYARLFKKPIDWGFWSEPQEHLLNRKIYLPRGKTLGGCSSTNAMAYVRGNPEDYNDWSEMGNTGWDYASVLPYFIKSEGNAQYEELDKEYHGQDGPLHVSFPQKFKTPFGKAFIEAGKQWGMVENLDYNGAKQNGIGYFQFTIKDGKRHSGASAFLKPVLERYNLKALTKARVTRILIKNDRAIGVSFSQGREKPREVLASKEVILCAGAFQSPQLLMLSGVGDQAELKKHKIDPVKHLPGVGQNLQDHLFYGVGASTIQQEGLNHYIPIWGQLRGLWRYLVRKDGAFTQGPLEARAFVNVDQPGGRVNAQFHFAPMHIGKGYDYDVYDLNTYPSHDGFTILPTLLRPHSRGYVRLQSADPLADPVIQPNFLSVESDLQLLLKAGKIALELLKQEAFAPYVKERVSPLDISSDDAIIEHIRKSVETVYHPVGTCKMGVDDMSVVDPELRVHGVGGLRVVDASIMPSIVSGNTNAPVYMIAEKAADMILGKSPSMVEFAADDSKFGTEKGSD